MSENYFDERIAATYEAKWPELFEPAVVDPAVSFLADLARSGTALELGIGTGRLALPLSERGIRVHGIELSPAMAARLRAKPGADGIGVTLGDFATAKVGETFGLAYLVRNTIMNLTTQEGQVDCFRNVAGHLEPGGCFVIEVIVPELQRLPPGETIRAFTVTPRHPGFDASAPAKRTPVTHVIDAGPRDRPARQTPAPSSSSCALRVVGRPQLHTVMVRGGRRQATAPGGRRIEADGQGRRRG